METLEQKIEKLKKNNATDMYFAELLDEIDHMVVHSEPRSWVTISLADGEQILVNKILELMPPTNKTSKVYEADGYMQFPYKMSLNNPAVCNSANRYELKLTWSFGEYDVWLKIPTEWIRNYVDISSRKPNETELDIYFPRSGKKFTDNLTVRRYIWPTIQNKYYGGSCDLCDGSFAERVFNYLKELR